MSIPPELRVLCHQLSHTPNAQLPHVTPSLQRLVFRCQGPLTTSGAPNSKSDSSESSVLVHKLKTQISTLLHGRTPEGRFTAVVLIKGIIDTGGWEVLRGAESWVRGLLGVLGKPDSIATKRLCILTLTDIYLKTHQYQSLVREITTPTLPTFVSSCLNLISKGSKAPLDTPSPLGETVFEAFSRLVSRHPTIFRPFLKQIRAATRNYLAPTATDGKFISSSLSQSARHLNVLLHQTAPKNTGGEEWGKAVRDLLRESHETGDRVFRAVLEDWESTAGYVSQQVDINGDVHGGAQSEDDLPAWKGIDAGLERLIGLLALLEEHFKYHTSTAVTIPLDSLVDLLTRLLSISPPSISKKGTDNDGVRLHPAIEQDEREGLWAGLPSVHIAAMRLYSTLIDRVQTGFTPYGQACLDQVSWIYPIGKNNAEHREFLYKLTGQTLRLCGPSLTRQAVIRLSALLVGCCREFNSGADTPSTQQSATQPGGTAPKKNGVTPNVDSFLKAKIEEPDFSTGAKSAVQEAAAELLPLFLSHLPQQHLDAYIRIEIERTAILAHEESTMLASILNPYIGKNGRAFPSILPHAARQFSEDPALESILRPRMPVLLQQSGSLDSVADGVQVPVDLPAKEEFTMVSNSDAHAEHVFPPPHGQHASAEILDSSVMPPISVTENDIPSTRKDITSTQFPTAFTSFTNPVEPNVSSTHNNTQYHKEAPDVLDLDHTVANHAVANHTVAAAETSLPHMDVDHTVAAAEKSLPLPHMDIDHPREEEAEEEISDDGWSVHLNMELSDSEIE